jgi:hypothetical protein
VRIAGLHFHVGMNHDQDHGESQVDGLQMQPLAAEPLQNLALGSRLHIVGARPRHREKKGHRTPRRLGCRLSSPVSESRRRWSTATTVRRNQRRRPRGSTGVMQSKITDPKTKHTTVQTQRQTHRHAQWLYTTCAATTHVKHPNRGPRSGHTLPRCYPDLDLLR